MLLSLERILRWQPKSTAAVLAGGHPTPTPDDDQVEPLTVIEHLVQLRAEIADLKLITAQLTETLLALTTIRVPCDHHGA